MLCKCSIHILTIVLLVLLCPTWRKKTIWIKVLLMPFRFPITVFDTMLTCFSLWTLSLELLRETLPVFHIVHSYRCVARLSFLDCSLMISLWVMLMRVVHWHASLVSLTILTTHWMLIVLCIFATSTVCCNSSLSFETARLFACLTWRSAIEIICLRACYETSSCKSRFIDKQRWVRTTSNRFALV